MFEVKYGSPVDLEREGRVAKALEEYGGTLTYREVPEHACPSQAVILTFEFAWRPSAEAAAERLRLLGEIVEGPCDYGDD